jgi:hypothetical protein
MNFSANQGFAALLAGSGGAAKPTEKAGSPAGGKSGQYWHMDMTSEPAQGGLAGSDEPLATAVTIVALIVTRCRADQGRGCDTCGGPQCGTGQAVFLAGNGSAENPARDSTGCGVLVCGLTPCKSKGRDWSDKEQLVHGNLTYVVSPG